MFLKNFWINLRFIKILEKHSHPPPDSAPESLVKQELTTKNQEVIQNAINNCLKDTGVDLGDLLKLRKENYLLYKAKILRLDIEERCKKGPLNPKGDDPERWLKEADAVTDPENDILASWQLDMAATEYIFRAANGDHNSQIKAMDLLKRILKDENMAKEYYPQYIQIVKNNPKSS